MLRRVLLFAVLLLGLDLALIGAERPSLVLGRGGEGIEVSDSESHQLWLRISGAGRIRLEQFMVSPLRSSAGEVRDLLRCWVRFQGPSTGRIDWVPGELVSRSPKLVFVSSGLEGAETRLVLEYRLDSQSCKGEYTGVLGLVAYPQDDPSNKAFVSVPVKVVCGSGLDLLRVSTGKELLVESGRSSYVELLANGRVVLMKDRRLPELEVRVVADDREGAWLSFRRSLELVIKGKVKLEFRVPKGVKAGDWEGTVYFRSEAATLSLPARVRVSPRVELRVDRSGVALRIDPKTLESSVGELVISIDSNMPERVALVQELRSKYLIGPGIKSLPIENLEYSVQKKEGEDWKTILPWQPVGIRTVLFKMGKDEFQAQVRVLYRLRVKRISDVPAGEYQLPVRLSVVVD